MTNDDLSLLRQYARHNSEEAFATLVSRHVNLVYSVALRSVNDTHLAQDITQAVFVILSRKAGSLGDKTILPAWLYRTAQYASLETLRNNRRRRWREHEASMQSISNESDPDLWPDIKPLLNGAMDTLGRKDYDALVLRFFENKNFAQVGAALGASEDAAKMRVSRALEKLRNFFAKRGVHSTAETIAGAISANSIQVAPLTLAKSITAVALAKSAASTSTLTLIKGTLKLMAWSQAKTAILVAVGILLAAGITTATVKIIRDRNSDVWRVRHFDFETVLREAPPQVRIIPSKFAFADFQADDEIGVDARHVGIAVPFPSLIQNAFQVQYGDRIICPADSPQGLFDFIANLPHSSSTALQREIQNKLGMTGQYTNIGTDALVLKIKDPNRLNLKPGVGSGRWSDLGANGINDTNELMSDFAGQLEEYAFYIPVIDQTGLSRRYDIKLPYNYGDNEDLKRQLLDQLGLELVSTNMPIQMLVMKKVK